MVNSLPLPRIRRPAMVSTLPRADRSRIWTNPGGLWATITAYSHNLSTIIQMVILAIVRRKLPQRHRRRPQQATLAVQVPLCRPSQHGFELTPAGNQYQGSLRPDRMDEMWVVVGSGKLDDAETTRANTHPHQLRISSSDPRQTGRLGCAARGQAGTPNPEQADLRDPFLVSLRRVCWSSLIERARFPCG